MGFAVHQEKTTYGLGYLSTLAKKKDDAILNKAEAIADARIKIVQNHWYVPHYTASVPQEGILSEQILSRRPTELHILNDRFLGKRKIGIYELRIR